jgi:hypothetical protein
VPAGAASAALIRTNHVSRGADTFERARPRANWKTLEEPGGGGWPWRMDGHHLLRVHRARVSHVPEVVTVDERRRGLGPFAPYGQMRRAKRWILQNGRGPGLVSIQFASRMCLQSSGSWPVLAREGRPFRDWVEEQAASKEKGRGVELVRVVASDLPPSWRGAPLSGWAPVVPSGREKSSKKEWPRGSRYCLRHVRRGPWRPRAQ